MQVQRILLHLADYIIFEGSNVGGKGGCVDGINGVGVWLSGAPLWWGQEAYQRRLLLILHLHVFIPSPLHAAIVAHKWQINVFSGLQRAAQADVYARWAAARMPRFNINLGEWGGHA